MKRGRSLLRGGAVLVFWLLVLTGAILFSGALWVRRTFGRISIDQMLMNLPGGDGAGGDGLMTSAVVSILLIPFGIVLLLALLCEKSRRELRRGGVLRGRRRGVLRGIAAVLAVAVPLGGAGYLGATLRAGEYVTSLAREASGGNTLSDYYAVPRQGVEASGRGADIRTVGGSGSQHLNLVIIYLESIEDAFAEEQTFEKNMLAPVQNATRGWSSIPELRQYEGGGWTMAGIVSTQCGIPLRSGGSLGENIDLNSLGSEGNEITSYLPGATCLGDVLAREGYRNVFMGGADANFAGKGSFFETHGYKEVHDLREWRELGETEIREDWGLSDRRLFERARDEIDRLHAQDQPFNLTMLTLDTHEPTHLHDYCAQETDAPLTSITLCSMRQVSEFVAYMEDRGYLEDTTVVLMGDHEKLLAPESSFWEEMKDREDRTIFNRIWAPGGVEFARDEIDQFSMYPTLLELAGIELADHRAGIGVSALADRSDVPAGSILDLDAAEYRAVVTTRASGFYRELWEDERDTGSPPHARGRGTSP